MTHTVRLRLKPSASVIEIDGHDIAHGLRGVRIDARAGSLPEITLDLAVWDVTELESEEAVVIVPDSTAEALKALGWTPPEVTS